MLDLELLHTFLAVAAGLSFRRAAQALHAAPSTVTARIKALEDSLGLPLFDRVGGRVLLTGHGERLVPQARRLLDLEAETRRRMAGEDESPAELAVRISESLGIHCLPRMLPRFRERFPDTRLTLLTASTQGLARDLRQGAADLALLLGEPFSAPEIEMEELAREPLAVITAPGSALARLGRVGPEDLAGVPLILTRHVWSARRLIEQALHAAQVSPPGVVECGSVEIVKRCVAAGLGVSVAPFLSVRQEVERGELAALDWTPGALGAPVLLVRHARRWMSAAAQAFADQARAFFRPEAR